MIVILIVLTLTFLYFETLPYREYKKSTYYQLTQLPYHNLRNDNGKHGEYLIYSHLNFLEASGAKFLFNLYIPKVDGKTTEIDVLLLTRNGIFLFESKNFSGWIFGSEQQKYWYQTLPVGPSRQSHKEPFYNPVMQNKAHLLHLKNLIGDSFPIHSIVVFSNHCTFKGVHCSSTSTHIIQLRQLTSCIHALCGESPPLLTDDDINTLYTKLYPYTQADPQTKARHITNIVNASYLHRTSHPTTDAHTSPPSVASVPASPSSAEEADIRHAVPSSNKNSSNQPELRCPKCGGLLWPRISTTGPYPGSKFYGCTNFPECRYSQPYTKKDRG